MDFQLKTLDAIISEAISADLLSLFLLKKPLEDVKADCQHAVQNIQTWLSLVLKPDRNQYGISFKELVAAEQEFNTRRFGIKGNIDATVLTVGQNG
jgi:hypothetical protein